MTLFRKFCLFLFLPMLIGKIGGIPNGQLESSFHFAEVVKDLSIGSDRKSFRDNDPSYIVPHLYYGDVITLKVCPETWMNVSFMNLTYSNDGASDVISLFVNHHQLGELSTLYQSDWGRYWDTFLGSGFIGHSGVIPPGRHTITINITRSDDCYGVELGTLYISVDKKIVPDSFWCGSDVIFAPTKPDCKPPIEDNKSFTTKADVTSTTATIPTTTTATTTTTTVATTTTIPPTYVTVAQNSFKTDCLDKQNVKISFSSGQMVGTKIVVGQNKWSHLGRRSFEERDKSSGTRFCESGIWQLGHIDGDNKEFQSLYPGKSFVINVTNNVNQDANFPAKILPFVTKDITINFNLPENLNIEQGSAYFALGFVNLTKPVEVGLQYFDHTKNSFSEIHVMKFTSRWHTMGWNIPNLGKTKHRENMFILHFESESNVIMFDFLKLEFTTRDERKSNILITRTNNWKVRGLRYKSSKGITVTVDQTQVVHDIENVVFLNKVFPLSKYQHVLSILSDGYIYPYKPFRVKSSETEKYFVDISGLVFGNYEAKPMRITTVHFDTSTDVISIHYQDGSVVSLRVMASLTNSQIQVVGYRTGLGLSGSRDKHTLTFVSTHVTDYLAAVNTVSGGRVKDRNVIEDMSDMSGHFAYTFTKTSPTSMYYANDFFEIIFPY